MLQPSRLAILALALAACAPTDPKDPKTHIAALSKKDPKKVADAVRELRKMKAKEALAPITALLRHDDMNVRDEAAFALGDFGDPSSVQALTDAIDIASGAKGAERANSRIAESLGRLGDKKATGALVRMLAARNDYVRLAAVDALTDLKDPSSVPALVRLVEDEGTAPLITKKAIIALGEMRAADAVNALCKAMVMERSGVSFYAESSFSLFQIGSPAAEALRRILAGEDKPFLTWAADKGRDPAGYLSKSAVVLSDIGDPSVIPALVKLMAWKHPDGNDVFQMLVRGTAADALGRLRAKEGAAAIAGQVNVAEANIREKFAIALAHIGDVKVLPKLEAAAKNPKDTWGARQSAFTGIALLGDLKSRKLFDLELKAQAGDNAVKNCMKEPTAGELDAMKAARCDKERVARPKFLEDELARLQAADECRANVDCWIGKLKAPIGKVRERAAYELGKSGDPKGVPALVSFAKDDDLGTRRAVYIGLDWYTRLPAAKDALKAASPGLSKQLEDEKGKAYTIVVNEDLRRVAWKLQQL